MRSYESPPISGTYRAACCRREVYRPKGAKLPACPACGKRAQWALVNAVTMRSRRRFDPREFPLPETP